MLGRNLMQLAPHKIAILSVHELYMKAIEPALPLQRCCLALRAIFGRLLTGTDLQHMEMVLGRLERGLKNTARCSLTTS